MSSKGPKPSEEEATVHVKTTDLSDAFAETVANIAATAIDQLDSEVKMASQIKAAIEREDKPHWHVTVGKQFGRLVSRFLYHRLFWFYVYVCPMNVLISL